MTRKRRRSDAPLRTVFVPEELIAEILPFLSVKTILRFKCLSKSWNNFISDSNFVEKHLKNSSQNSHLTLVWNQKNLPHIATKLPYNVVPYPVHLLFKNKNPSINVYKKYDHRKESMEPRYEVVGSCNGLLCLLFSIDRWGEPRVYWLCFFNPATREKSINLGLLHGRIRNSDGLHGFKFTFGYDASTRTYKVVAAQVNQASWKTDVKIFSLGDNRWRNIQSFPVVPLNGLNGYYRDISDGVHLSGTVNWLAIDTSITHVKKSLIVSLDLSMETYNQFLLPSDFDDEVPSFLAVLRVLMNCLSFSHDSKKIEFILWQMKEYGVRESWTPLFKISYQNLQMHLPEGYHASIFRLACLYVNGDNLIFAKSHHEFHDQAFIYNLKDETVKIINTRRNRIRWFDMAKDYGESLVPVCWESATPT